MYEYDPFNVLHRHCEKDEISNCFSFSLIIALASANQITQDGASDTYAIPVGPMVDVGTRIGKAIAIAIAKGNGCRRGCNGSQCAIASGGFKGHC